MDEYTVILVVKSNGKASAEREVTFWFPAARITRVVKNNGFKHLKG